MVQLDPHLQYIQPCDISLDGYDIHLGWRFPWGGVNTENFSFVSYWNQTTLPWGYGGCVDFSWGCGYPQRVPRAHAPRGLGPHGETRVELRARFYAMYATEGYFPVLAFFLFFIGVLLLLL